MRSLNQPRIGSSPRVRGTRRSRACPWPSNSVHPRVCGELGTPSPLMKIAVGSSPRVRGTPSRRRGERRASRFIPACAGNSPRRRWRASRRSVHPRVCGELDSNWRIASRRSGSSPRVRGTRGVRRSRSKPRRFIPACAGNSRWRRSSFRTPPVHPRVCGELGEASRRGGTAERFIPACAGNSKTCPRRRCAGTVHPRVCGELPRRHRRPPGGTGSSPRVRGTRSNRSHCVRHGRFIPACAGNSAAQSASSSAKSGSSPRVRGTQREVEGDRARSRFIPACAGNSRECPRPPIRPPVHPRVCGELRSSARWRCAKRGSSPRVRGTRSGSAASTTSAPVHPRVCGELIAAKLYPKWRVGSSPRVRGTRRRSATRRTARSVHPRVCGELGQVAVVVVVVVRFIPACAGNSPPRSMPAPNVVGSSPRVRGTHYL